MAAELLYRVLTEHSSYITEQTDTNTAKFAKPFIRPAIFRFVKVLLFPDYFVETAYARL